MNSNQYTIELDGGKKKKKKKKDWFPFGFCSVIAPLDSPHELSRLTTKNNDELKTEANYFCGTLTHAVHWTSRADLPSPDNVWLALLWLCCWFKNQQRVDKRLSAFHLQFKGCSQSAWRSFSLHICIQHYSPKTHCISEPWKYVEWIPRLIKGVQSSSHLPGLYIDILRFSLYTTLTQKLSPSSVCTPSSSLQNVSVSPVSVSSVCVC